MARREITLSGGLAELYKVGGEAYGESEVARMVNKTLSICRSFAIDLQSELELREDLNNSLRGLKMKPFVNVSDINKLKLSRQISGLPRGYFSTENKTTSFTMDDVEFVLDTCKQYLNLNEDEEEVIVGERRKNIALMMGVNEFGESIGAVDSERVDWGNSPPRMSEVVSFIRHIREFGSSVGR